MAYGVDAVLLFVLVALALGYGPRVVPPALLWAAAVAFVVVQLLAVALSGRTMGRWLVQLRTVDDLTGLPVGPGHVLRALTQGTRIRVLTADLRLGRDPVTPQLTTPTRDGGAAVSPPSALAVPPETGLASGADQGAGEVRPSVGIVLESGERYEIHHALLIGRSPVDPVVGANRALLAWPDLSRRLAKTHVLLEWSGSVLWVTDLNSMTGTTLVTAGGDRQPLAAGVRTGAPVGSLIVCGGRSVKVVPHG